MYEDDLRASLDAFVAPDAPICYGILMPGEHCNNGVPVIKVKNIVGGRVIEADLLKTSIDIHKKYKRSEVAEGDILLTIRGSTGRVAMVPKSLSGANITQDTARVRVKAEDNALYVYYALQSPIVQRQIELNTIGQAVKGINISEVKKIKIFHPSGNVQNKIAEILSAWDKAIITTEQLLANSQQQKNALMQHLLTGKKRFGYPDGAYGFKKTRYGYIPEDWNYPAIKEVCMQVSDKNSDAANHPVLSCSKHVGFVDSLKYFNKKVYSDDTSGYRVIPRGCFGFPSNHIEEGSIGLQNMYDYGIVSPIYVVFKAKPEKVDNNYLISLLKTEHYRQIFSAATNASVDRRGSLRWKEFSTIHVPLPPLQEQMKIAELLSSADQEIGTLELKLAAIKDEKKALMQLLLTGKRRVKVGE